MKSIYIWLGAFFLFLIACSPKEENLRVTVHIKQYEKENCVHICHQLKVSIHNQTEDSIFLTALQMDENLFVINREGEEYRFGDFHEGEYSYYWEHVKTVFADSSVNHSINGLYDGPFLMDYDTLQLFHLQHYNQYYESFAANAANKELEGIIKEYNLNTISSYDSAYLEDLIKVKYSSVVLLGPGESTYQIFDINTMVKKGYKVFFRYEYFNKNDDSVQIHLDDPDKTVEIRSDYPEKVSGYKLFEGIIESKVVELK
jgi:hypothetical protein